MQCRLGCPLFLYINISFYLCNYFITGNTIMIIFMLIEAAYSDGNIIHELLNVLKIFLWKCFQHPVYRLYAEFWKIYL